MDNSSSSTASSSTPAPPPQQHRRPGFPAAAPAGNEKYAAMGMSVGLTFICGSVVVGAIALATGRKPLYDRLFRWRMVAVATTFGFYSTASGFLPPPPLLSSILGKEPRPLPDVPSQLGTRSHPPAS